MKRPRFADVGIPLCDPSDASRGAGLSATVAAPLRRAPPALRPRPRSALSVPCRGSQVSTSLDVIRTASRWSRRPGPCLPRVWLCVPRVPPSFLSLGCSGGGHGAFLMESLTNLAQGPALRPSPLLVMMERACLAGQTHGRVNTADVGCYPGAGGRTQPCTRFLRVSPQGPGPWHATGGSACW